MLCKKKIKCCTIYIIFYEIKKIKFVFFKKHPLLFFTVVVEEALVVVVVEVLVVGVSVVEVVESVEVDIVDILLAVDTDIILRRVENVELTTRRSDKKFLNIHTQKYMEEEC
eukprot:GHVU01063821.1.p1 GENE.GHVU01063821.1~~GHVU01063821.1.p1  ORF type:complete len:112 (-),score=13.68 GHVU01063821.1:151-486(-)